MPENRHAVAIAVAILMAVLPITAVGLRLRARRIKKVELKADDYTVIVALVVVTRRIFCLILTSH